jgi:hypothetical protein
MQIRLLTKLIMKNSVFFKPSLLSSSYPTNTGTFNFYSTSFPSSSTEQQSLSTKQAEDEELKKRIQQTSDYFNQYIEEYYE